MIDNTFMTNNRIKKHTFISSKKYNSINKHTIKKTSIEKKIFRQIFFPISRLKIVV